MLGEAAGGTGLITPRLRVGILGAGRIAQGFDAPGSRRILSLAHAVKRSRCLELGSFFDLGQGRAAAAEAKWGCPASPRHREAWLDSGWDVVIIATPDASHPADLRDVLARHPRAVMVEKPLALDGSEALRLLRRAERAKVAVAVNFPRRWHSGIQRVSRWFNAGTLGRPVEVRGRYSGGLKHNGIHLLDLVAAWFGAAGTVKRISLHARNAWLEFRIRAGLVSLLLADARQRNCYVWELECDTREARIELRGSPETLRVFRRRSHRAYRGHEVLVEERRWRMEDEPLLLRAVDHLASLAADPAAADAQILLEKERYRLFQKVFARLEAWSSGPSS